MQLSFIKSASIILQRSSGEIYLCRRSNELSFFPNFWVFPGGKIEHQLGDDWNGTEPEVYDTIYQELYEETGIVIGSTTTIAPDRRRGLYLDHPVDPDKKQEIKDQLVYIGKKRTPPFRNRLYDAAYYYLVGEYVDELHPVVDGNELIEGIWIQPEAAIQRWEEGTLNIPPPNLHILRNMLDQEHFITKTLIETELTVGLQTKIEFRPGYQLVPVSSTTIDPFFNTNLIIIEDEDDILLVDPGANTEGKFHLQELLYSLPQQPRVFITHHHQDHWAGLDIVQDVYPQAVVLSHPQTLDRINTALETESISSGIITVGSKKLQVLHTPGHTDSHLSLFDPAEQLLIAGDHVVGYGSAVLDPQSGSMSQYFQTTRELIELDVEIIFPAHGPPNFHGTALLQQYLTHRTEREDAILAAIESGKTTLDGIVEKVYQDVPPEMWEYAKHNIQLHIDKLREENRLPVNYSG